MNKLLTFCFPRLKQHLTDDHLASLAGEELSWFASLAARWHLARCPECRMRQESLKRRASSVMSLLQQDEERWTLAQLLHSDEAVRRLCAQVDSYVPRRRWSFHQLVKMLPELPRMNPILVTTLVFALATLISFTVWMQQRTLNITSNALLVRAENWDDAGLSTSDGVIYQQVRIRMPQATFNRAIYRDVRGRRHPRVVKLNVSQEQLRNRLVTAGVSWDAPLSASSYQDWHDHQRIRTDQIERSAGKTLTLTTTVPAGDVTEQTITVRDSDFHPVMRTIEFRDNERVEIAELEFKVLPWSAVDQSVFEPMGALNRATLAPPNVIPFPRLPETLSPEQLDETELSARLVLNRLHADVGKQMEIGRSSQGIEVSGVVETEERKRELEKQLAMLPHVKTAIESEIELRSNPGAGEGNLTSISSADMQAQTSPLETYLRGRGRDTGAIGGLAQQLFNNALLISQESKALNDLDARFGLAEKRTVIAEATRAELVYKHRERLEDALETERKLLNEIRGGTDDGGSMSVSSARSLLRSSERHMALCKELIATNTPAARRAEPILSELSASLDELVMDERNLHIQSRSGMAQDGRK